MCTLGYTCGKVIADSRLDIDVSDLIFKKRYHGTIEMYEVLVNKNPTNFNRDIENYKEIVKI